MMNCLRNQNGIALIVTLLALALITAMVVEFAYGVYTGTNNLYNWRDSQRLSIMAKSGINVTAKYLEIVKDKFTEPVELPVENPFEDFQGTITVRIADETGKFPINSIVPDNQIVKKDNDGPYKVFINLLKELSLDEKIADRVMDWIDKDSVAEVGNSEENAKNDALISVDELLLVNGIGKDDYKKLSPYITASGSRTVPQININTAEKPVLKSLFGNDDIADRIIALRKIAPFTDGGDLENRTGNKNIPTMVTFQSNAFFISSMASSGGVKRIIDTVVNTSSKRVEYWKEY